MKPITNMERTTKASDVVHGLQSVIDGTRTMPARLVKKVVSVLGFDGNTNDHEVFEEYSEYVLWDRQDNVLKSRMKCLPDSEFMSVNKKE